MKLADMVSQRRIYKVETLYPAMLDCVEQGEILNPAFNEWKDAVAYLVDEVIDNLRDRFVVGMQWKQLPEDLQNLELGHGLQGIKGWKKKISKIKGDSAFHPYILAINEAYDAVSPYLEITEQLKPLIIKVTQKRAQQHKKEAQTLAKKVDESKALVNVLKDNIDEFAKRGRDVAEKEFETWMDRLEKNDWNLDKLFPLVGSNRDAKNYVRSITDAQGNAKQYRKRSEASKERILTNAEEDARESYMAWVYKMIQKIGKPVVEAEVTGNIWVNTLIIARCNDGEEQRWNTKMIINRSKYGKLFHQFPSRRVK